MHLYLLLLLITLPILEVWVLLLTGRLTSPLLTIAAIVLTGVVGGLLARSQGLRTMLDFQRSLQEGRLPGKELLDGVFILVGGAVLLTPGFITDAFGFLCLIPTTRVVLQKWFYTWIQKKTEIKSDIIDIDYKDLQ
jgi:UPF0716 protein FxsA